MAYADITISDPNPVKRWLQGRRFLDVLGLLRDTGSKGHLQILDFGAGDGELVRQIAGRLPVQACVYEPTASLMSEARQKLSGLNCVTFVNRLDSLEPGIFDYVFCLEVFEHLPDKEISEAMADIHRLLKADGLALVGVPHELFLPALLKGIFRMSRRYGAFDASPKEILAATVGRPPSPRPVSEISPGFSYHFQHLGFDHRVLERKLQERFQLVNKWFSPFPLLGPALNSEVNFLLRKAQPSGAADLLPATEMSVSIDGNRANRSRT